MSIKRYYQVILAFILTSLLACCQPVMAQPVSTYVHPRAIALMPTIREEAETYFPNAPDFTYIPATFDKESCISYKHSWCFSGNAELKNNREHGVGIGQITRAWDTNGKLRFDNLQGMKKKYPEELGEMDWSTIKSRVDLQLRATILMLRDIYNSQDTTLPKKERIRFMASEYNGGRAHVLRARSTCKLTTGCNPNVWYKNVEVYLPKSKAPDSRYGGRSLYQVNTDYVVAIEARMPKYSVYFKD